MNLARFPRHKLTFGPTPIEALPRLVWPANLLQRISRPREGTHLVAPEPLE